MDTNLYDRIAGLCLELYSKLGKNGKPQKGKEWTQLAGIVLEFEDKLQLVSLATGTKCIGINSMCSEGTILNDSHAEVLARRAFLRFMYEEIRAVKNGNHSEILKWQGPKYVLFDNLKWHMYTSQVPCGDASIIPMEEEISLTSKKRKIDVHRTGAKLLHYSSVQDPKKSGVEYHIKGAVRTKPGRGDPTISLSCSDKIARWIYGGLQGALLSHLIEGDVKLATLIIGAGGPFNQEIISNSLIGRSGVVIGVPKILQTNLIFRDSSFNVQGGKPVPTSIIWSNVLNRPINVSSRGRCLGTTSKSIKKGVVDVSKRELLKQFLSLHSGNWKTMTYREIKECAEKYQSINNTFKRRMGILSEKYTFENFTL